MTHTEMARLLRQPVGTVKSRIRAGMMRLREGLEPLLA
jgi:DNA-directed RNA polymerase specialized sigma24 family protein